MAGRLGRSGGWKICVLLALLMLAPLRLWASYDHVANTPPLTERLTPEVLAAVFPGADRIEMLDDGGPDAAAVLIEEELAGYIFSTLDVLRAPGYSATPFDVIAGVGNDGRITGAAVLFHREPYIHNDERRTGQLLTFLGDFEGMESRSGATDGPAPHFVAGATISARAMRNAVREGANLVLRYRSDATVVSEPTLDMVNFRPRDAQELIADGSVGNVVLTNADLEAALARAGADALKLEVAPKGEAGDVYIDFRVALALPPTIGRNGAGVRAYGRLFTEFPPGSPALIFGSNGTYDWRGFRFNNASNGFRLERIAVFQDGQEYHFFKESMLGITARLGRASNILVLPPDSGFDPMRPWRAELYVYGDNGVGEKQQVLLTAIDYELPDRFILMPPAPPVPAWVEAWQDSAGEIAVLGAALGVLTLIFAFQGPLSRARRAHTWVRNGFLAFTLVWLGWIAGGQLSIVHLLNYLQAPFQGLELSFYLSEPLIVMLSAYTAVALLLIGRGVFCGWLCPFGALQELLAKAARAMRLPQWQPSPNLQRRLWWGKYAALALVVGLAFLAPAAGAMAAEVEPFKTAITAMFARTWPFVLYALVLLFIGLFTERAFCRFLCPLGGALAVLDRLHILTLLKRRPECGNPCSLCERACPVRAIAPTGEIRMAECFQCLDCQVEYNDPRRCPPLARMRKRDARTGEAPAPARAGVAALSRVKGVTP